MIDILRTSEFILNAFELLGRRPLAPEQLDALRIPAVPSALVAVSQHRDLFLLLEIGPEVAVGERRLRALQVGEGNEYAVYDVELNQDIEQRFAVIRLREGHEDLATSFALVVSTLLATLEDSPTSRDIASFIDSLVSLLAPPRKVPPATATGLWGELWVIINAPTPREFAAAWHAGSKDRFDFSFPTHRIEVKTTTAADRVHEFSLDQLTRDDTKPTWVASLQAVQDPSGETILDLLGQLVVRVPRREGERVSRIALETLTGDIESAQDYAFAPFGPQPLLAFLATDIPRVEVPTGSGISGVRFRADLDRVAPRSRSLTDLVRSLPQAGS